LLLTTCFLGLRRYLRQKRLQMPAAMTGAWLLMGGLLLGGLLIVGALLPRPYAEFGLSDVIDRAGSAKRSANRMSVKGDSPGEGKGQPGAGNPDAKGEGGQTGEKGKGPGQGKDKGKSSGKGDNKDGGSKSENKGDNDSGKNSGEPKQNPDNRNQGDKDKSGQEPRDSKQGNQSGNQANTAKAMKNMEKSASSSSAPQFNALRQLFQRIGPVLKWVVFAVLAIVVIGAFLRGGLGFLANFTDWARRMLDAWRNFWANLFGGAKKDEETAAEEEALADEAERGVPFSAYSNPFDSGKADRLSPRELVRYSFRALEAWARERDLERQPGETALEFIDRVASEVPALETEARRLGQLQGRAEYARAGLPANTADHVRAFWEKLERVAAMPLSA
jgi:hypothetical protein